MHSTTLMAPCVPIFRCADIRKIENLADCVNLQELNLSGNEITSIEGLERLHHLRKLILTTNKIESLSGLEVH